MNFNSRVEFISVAPVFDGKNIKLCNKLGIKYKPAELILTHSFGKFKSIKRGIVVDKPTLLAFEINLLLRKRDGTKNRVIKYRKNK